MEPLIRFQCWGSSPEDGGGERQRFDDGFGEVYVCEKER